MVILGIVGLGGRQVQQRFVLVALFLVSAIPVFSQVESAGKSRELQLTLGAGFSNYDVDWGHGRMDGGAVWVDFPVPFIPKSLDGFGFEAEARDISLGHSATQPANFRFDTVGGGVIYTWRHFRDFRPYSKYLASFGGIDWNNPNPLFLHETRTVTALGGGLEFRVHKHIWLRADEEYQFWPDIDLQRHPLTDTHVLDPQGFTVGLSYDFRHLVE